MNNWVDFVILATLALPTLAGFRVGLIRVVTGLASIAIGIMLATTFWRQVAALVEPFVTDERLAAFIGYSSIIILTVIAGIVVAFLLRTVLTMLLLGWVDKVGGIAVGFVLGSIIVTAMIFALESFGGNFGRDALAASGFSGYFDFLVPVLEVLAGEIDFPSVSPSDVAGMVSDNA